jgi:hypothetical protein
MSALSDAIRNHQVSITALSTEAAKELQTLLCNAGFLNSAIDGKVGPKTLAAFATFKESVWLGEPVILWKPSLEKLIELGKEAKRAIASQESNTPVPISQGKRIEMLGAVYYSDQPIIPGGSFTWGEATHDGTRPFKENLCLANTVKLARLLQSYRDKFGGSWVVTSWNRPEPFNSRCGGAKFSQHKVGAAVDLNVRKDGRTYTAMELMPLMRNWQGGMGIYPGKGMRNVLHVDCRPGLSRWNGSWWPQ